MIETLCRSCGTEIAQGFGCLCSSDDSLTGNVPSIGDCFQHRNGNKYTVILIANAKSENSLYPVTVVYQGINKNIWTKAISNFNRSMTKVVYNV